MGEEDSIKHISRRDFLKTAGIVAGHLAFPVAERGSG